MKVAVLGAGVIGVTSAYFLARAGHAVTVVDRQPDVAQETSFANGGQISVSHAEPWANPQTPLKALCWFGREDAPLLFRPRAEAALLDWSLRFLRECLPGRTHANVRAIVALALYSRSRLKALRQELAAEGGLEYQLRERGILHFYTDRREYAAACEASKLMRELGCNRRPVDVDECIAIEPALAGIRARLVGADFTAEDESGDAQHFTAALAAHCRRLGVDFRLGAGIDGLRRRGGQIEAAIVDGQPLSADAYVVALGSYSPLLLRPLGIAIPVYPAKGYSVTIPLGKDSIAPNVSLTDDEFKIVFSRLGDRLRVAGTAEFSGYNLDLNTVRCELLTRRVESLFADLRPAGEPIYWTGLRPATPSNVPLIGRSKLSNLWLNTGHGTLGWTMACGSGAALADLLSGRTPAADFPFLRG